MRKFLLLLVILSANCLSAIPQTSSQTKTATLFNWNGNPFLNLWAQEGSQYVSADDGSYAYSKKLSSHHGNLSLTLQDFHFDIPALATIDNITVRARRFKKGKGSITDYFANLLIPGPGFYNPSPYGVRFTNSNNYPDIETEVLYSEGGTGNNGGLGGNEAYQWTPALVNDQAFGVRIDTYDPARGSVVVYYDLVEITVEYSEPVTLARKSTDATRDIKPLKEPIVFPNPFTAKTNIQFTAAENGNVIVELYNATGIKVRTLFSSVVVEGQVYNISVGGAMLPKGIYVYIIKNGAQKQTGRLIKLE